MKIETAQNRRGIDITVLCTYDYVFQMHFYKYLTAARQVLQLCCFELEQKPGVTKLLVNKYL